MTTKKLQDQIRHFRSILNRNISNKKLIEELNKVILYNGEFTLPIITRSLPKGTNFYRIRKLNTSILPPSEITSFQDYWSPPTTVINTYGRINKPHESILYTALDPDVCVSEMKLVDGDFFILIKYTSIKEIKFPIITEKLNSMFDPNFKALSINWNEYELINDFIHTEFVRDVGIGTEYLYQTSEYITKFFYDYPEEMQDAWCYPSVHNQDTFNIAFRPEKASECLEFNGVMFCKHNDNMPINVMAVSDEFDHNNQTLIYEIGSKKQLELFPEIQINN